MTLVPCRRALALGLTALALCAAAPIHAAAAPADPANPFAAKNRRVEFRAARG